MTPGLKPILDMLQADRKATPGEWSIKVDLMPGANHQRLMIMADEVHVVIAVAAMNDVSNAQSITASHNAMSLIRAVLRGEIKVPLECRHKQLAHTGDKQLDAMVGPTDCLTCDSCKINAEANQ